MDALQKKISFLCLGMVQYENYIGLLAFFHSTSLNQSVSYLTPRRIIDGKLIFVLIFPLGDKEIVINSVPYF